MTKPIIKFGPAGFGMPAEQAFPKLKQSGLQAAEVEFTYGVKMSDHEAEKIGALAREYGISLSVHAPYYINLDSEEIKKIRASKSRILDSCKKADLLGARYVVFHAAFYGKHSKEECYKMVKESIIEMHKTIRHRDWCVVLAPETTGKASQFGDLDELIKLHKETGCFLCIDFAHLKARCNGEIDYGEVFEKLKNANITELHCHFSGIEFTKKGERRHVITTESNWKEILPLFRKFGFSGTIINESPSMWKDSLNGKKIWEKY